MGQADTAPEFCVVGLGDPVMDILAHVSHDFLATVAQEPGGCFAVSAPEMAGLLATAGAQSELVRIPGGSAANVMKGLATIASGLCTCRFLGMVGHDATGQEYRRKLTEKGVDPLLLESTSPTPSACAVCFVTPDGQRTMRTCLGASLELQSASQLSQFDWARGLRLLHCEGYALYRPQLTRDMAAAAKAAGALVSIDLASFELVRNCRASFVSLLEEGLLDLVFANEEESLELANVLELTPAAADKEERVHAAQQYLLKHCQVAITSLGPRGCVVQGRNGEVGASAASKVTVVDTIGAGDYFTAGFLSAYLQGANLQQSAAAGCASGCEAVQARGAELSPAAVQRLQQSLAKIVSSKPCNNNNSGSAVLPGAAASAAAALNGRHPNVVVAASATAPAVALV